MTNIVNDLRGEGSAQQLSAVLQGMGSTMDSPQLTKDQLFQIAKDFNFLAQQLMAVVAAATLQDGQDPETVMYELGYDHEFIAMCWFVAHPSQGQGV